MLPTCSNQNEGRSRKQSNNVKQQSNFEIVTLKLRRKIEEAGFLGKVYRHADGFGYLIAQ